MNKKLGIHLLSNRTSDTEFKSMGTKVVLSWCTSRSESVCGSVGIALLILKFGIRYAEKNVASDCFVPGKEHPVLIG